jgi:hypothetical protein
MQYPGQQEQFPFLHPGMYNPAQFAFTNNAEMSNMISLFAQPLIGHMAGPGNFLPHMMPGQALQDQFAMHNYQNQTRTATFNLANQQNDDVAKRLLGIRSAFTGEEATDLNKAQAENMAGILNNPATKMLMGSMLGEENVEALLHGSRGDVQSLGASVNRMGYFRRDPGGGGRMDAESLEDLTTGVFSHMYEPQGDLNKLASRARENDKESISRLQEAADMTDKTVVADEDVQERLQRKGDTRVDSLYKKYVQGGKATTAEEQAKELTRFDRAIKEADILGNDEATISQLQTKAKNLPTEQMHGFMAGQMAKVTENLSQRGMLPPSVGSLSAEGRVGAIAETKLDAATIDRLAQTMAKRDVEGGDKDATTRYNEATDDAAKQKELDAATDRNRQKLENTKAAADNYAAGTGNVSAEEIIQMGGSEALAGNVDASRTASKLKSYTDSLAAVRDIFGDNGNPNAPMPALMAALDHLTQGGAGAMNPAKMSSTLRQMQTLARETGTGMQQLGAISAQAGAIGSQLGIAPSITMQNVANTLGMTKGAMDAGAFSSNAFGAASKEQFQQETVTRLQEGAASGNAKAMAALSTIYKADPEKFKGTELEAAVSAYNDPTSDGKYTFNGEERNLYKDIGEGRIGAAMRVLQASGGSEQSFYAHFDDARSMDGANAAAGYLTQKHEITQRLSANVTSGMLSAGLRGTETGDSMNNGEMGDLSTAITGMVLDSGNMSKTDQITYLQKHMKANIVEHLKAKKIPDAEKKAEEIYQKMGGDDRTKLGNLIGNIGTSAQYSFGKNLTELSQRYGQNNDIKGLTEIAGAATRAETQKRFTGYESTIGQRASDYFLDIGERGEKFNLDQFMKAMAPAIGKDEAAQRFFGDAAPAMGAAAHLRDQVTVTKEHVDKLSKEGNIKELRKLAGAEESKVDIIDQSQLDSARETELSASGMNREQLLAEYKEVTKNTGAHLTDEQLRNDLSTDSRYIARADKRYLDKYKIDNDKDAMTKEGLTQQALARSVGKALEGMEGSKADVEAIEASLYKGDDENALKQGVNAAMRTVGKDLSKGKQDKLRDLILSKGDKKKEILSELGMSEEAYAAAAKKEAKDRTAEETRAVVLVGQGAAKNVRADKTAEQKDVDAKQKVDKANIEAGTVIINGKNVQGDGATPAQVGTAAAPAAGPAGAAKPGELADTTKSTLAEIDKELAQIDGKKASGDRVTTKDQERKKELIKQREEVIQQDPSTIKKPGTKLPEDSASVDAELASLAEKKKGTWFGLGGDDAKRETELKQRKEQLAAEEAKQKTSPTETADKKTDKPLEQPASAPAEKTAATDPATADEIAQKTAEATTAAAGLTGEELANQAIKEDEAVTKKERDESVSPSGVTPTAGSSSTSAETLAATGQSTLAGSMPEPRAAAHAAATGSASTGGLSSANIPTITVNAPQQAPAPTINITGGGDGGPMAITGRLEISGLQEAIVAATGTRPIATPNGGPSVIPGTPSGRG